MQEQIRETFRFDVYRHRRRGYLIIGVLFSDLPASVQIDAFRFSGEINCVVESRNNLAIKGDNCNLRRGMSGMHMQVLIMQHMCEKSIHESSCYELSGPIS